MLCSAGGGNKETQSLSGFQLTWSPESDLLSELRLLHRAPPLAQDGLQGTSMFFCFLNQVLIILNVFSQFPSPCWPVWLHVIGLPLTLFQIASQRVNSVDLSCCSLEELPAQLFYSHDLTHLNLKNNFISLHKGVPALNR